MRAAVGVRAVVGGGVEELADEVGVAGLQLHSVEARAHGVGRRGGEIVDGAWRCRASVMARGVVVGLLPVGVGARISGLIADGASGATPSEEVGVGDRAGVPQLGEDDAAALVHRVGHRRPAAHLLVGEKPWHVVPSDGVPADPDALGDDQPRRGALRVVLGVQFGRSEVGVGRPASGQRRHHHPVGQVQIAHAVGRQKRLAGVGGVRHSSDGSAHANGINAIDICVTGINADTLR